MVAVSKKAKCAMKAKDFKRPRFKCGCHYGARPCFYGHGLALHIETEIDHDLEVVAKQYIDSPRMTFIPERLLSRH